ncbi:MAG: diguanylate cyclase [Magnetococcales bacterium]|nr:diguanylate cyclase [Magnetococcales bacterium]MBF0632489.1 diguanylate cyclase [Magnetococcales bacterium]
MEENRMTLLLVDDEPFNLHLLQELLEPDYDLLLAKNGEQALQRVRTVPPPDLILLDIMMPGVDGYQVLERLQADPITQKIPVIFITAMGEVADEAKGLSLGAVDYISKPISLAIVEARVKTHLALRKSMVVLQELNAQLESKNDQLSKLNTILQNMAMRDGLTGIPNRRHFDQYLEQEWNRASRDQAHLSLILMDIDFFKPFNDHYGHAEGDECLKQVARALADAMPRSVDLLARYGGEEFVCVLPDTNLDGLIVVGNKLRETIHALGLPHHHSKVADHVTISMGGVSMIPSRDLLPASLVKAADDRLYRAKAAGRDRLVC